MDNGFGRKILNSTAFRAMAVALALCLIALPSVVFQPAKAAEFWGSYLAAITGAMALLAGAWYQDRLSRRRDFEERQLKNLDEALELYLWLGSCIRRLDRAAYRCSLFAEKLREGVQPLKPLTYGTMRELLTPILKTEAIGRTAALARLPAPVAETIFSAIEVLSDPLDAVHPAVSEDAEVLDLQKIEWHESQFKELQDIFIIGKARLAALLRKMGVPVCASDDDIKAPDILEKLAKKMTEA